MEAAWLFVPLLLEVIVACVPLCFLTVIAHVAVLPPSDDVAVIVAVPTFLAVTKPFSLTEATVESLDVQMIPWLVALVGLTVAVN